MTSKRFLSPFLAKKIILSCLASALLSTLALNWAKARAVSHLEQVHASLGSNVLHLLQRRLPQMNSSERSAMTMTLNGAQFVLQSASIRKSEASIEGLVEHLSEHCQRPSSRDEASRAPEALTPDLALIPAPQLVEMNQGHARFFCLKPKKTMTTSNLWETITRFSKSGNINHLGRPFSAEIRGSKDWLHLLFIEVTEGLVPALMFPESGDGPGSDHHEVPRPSGTRRISIAHEGQTILNSYTSSLGAREQLLNYAEKVHSSDAVVLTPPSKDEDTPPLARVVKTKSDTFLVTAFDHDEGDESSLIIARLPH